MADGKEPRAGAVKCFSVNNSERLFGEHGLGMDLFRRAGQYVIERSASGLSVANEAGTMLPDHNPMARVSRFLVVCLRPRALPPIEFLDRPFVEFRMNKLPSVLELSIDQDRQRVASAAMYEVERDNKPQLAGVVEDFEGLGVRLYAPADYKMAPEELEQEHADAAIFNMVGQLDLFNGLAEDGFFKLRFPPLES
jgi:hypothetical protein